MGGKFPIFQAAELRNELLQNGLDVLEAAEVIKKFITQYGYGTSIQSCRDVVRRVGLSGCNVETLHKEIETLALVM